MAVANPFKITAVLDASSSSAAELMLHGDEFLNWYTDPAGNPIIADRSGELQYATWDDNVQAFRALEPVTDTSYQTRNNPSFTGVGELPPGDSQYALLVRQRKKYRDPDAIPTPDKRNIGPYGHALTPCMQRCVSSHTILHPACVPSPKPPFIADPSIPFMAGPPSPYPPFPPAPPVPPGPPGPSTSVLQPTTSSAIISATSSGASLVWSKNEVDRGSIIRPILPIYVRFSDSEGGDLPNYHIEETLFYENQFKTLAHYLRQQTGGAVKLIDLGIRYVVLDTPGRNYSQRLDDVFDEIVIPALNKVAKTRRFDFFRAKRCNGDFHSCIIDPTECTPLFIVHGQELSAGGTGVGVWSHARWDTGKINIDGYDFIFDTYMVVGAFMGDQYMPVGNLVHEAGHALFYLNDLYGNVGASTTETEDHYSVAVNMFIEGANDTMATEVANLQSDIGTTISALEGLITDDWRFRVDYLSWFLDPTSSGTLVEGGIWRPGVDNGTAGVQEVMDLFDDPILSTTAVTNSFTAWQAKWIDEVMGNFVADTNVTPNYLKVMVIVTNLDNSDENPSKTMADIVSTAQTNGIVPVIVAPAVEQPTFQDFIDKTGGAFVDITSSTWTTDLAVAVAQVVVDNGTPTQVINTIPGDEATAGFGFWSPMSYGSWGSPDDDIRTLATLPVNMDAYSIQQINPRLTEPIYEDGSQLVTDFSTPHTVLLQGKEEKTLNTESFLVQRRAFDDGYDTSLPVLMEKHGALFAMSASGSGSGTSGTGSIGIPDPGLLIIHNWGKGRVPIYGTTVMPADIREANVGGQHLKMTLDDGGNYGDPDDLFGSTQDAFGDNVPDPDDFLTTNRDSMSTVPEVAGFNMTDISLVPIKSQPCSYEVSFTFFPIAPEVWNSDEWFPDDALKPVFPKEKKHWCYTPIPRPNMHPSLFRVMPPALPVAPFTRILPAPIPDMRPVKP